MNLPSSARGRALALLVWTLVLSGCSPKTSTTPDAGPKPSTPPPLVRVSPVEVRSVRRTIETSSYLESLHRVVIQSRVAGQIVTVAVDEGSVVKTGQVLAKLDDRLAASAVRQAEVQLKDKRVGHDLVKLSVEVAERRLESAKIDVAKAKAQYERNQAIDPKLIPEKDLDDSRFALETAQEALSVAEVDRRKADVDVLAAANGIAESEAKLDAEKLRLGDHTIISPIDGVVATRAIKGGETISGATELFVVVDQENLVCYLRRPQRELAMIRGAKEVTFTTDAVADHQFRAAIELISPTIDETSGSFSVRVAVLREDEQFDLLRPGMFVRARILAEDEREALMVPKAAVLNEGAVSAVFVVRDGVARRIVIEPGIEERAYLEALNRGEDGLAANDRVVTSGQQGLQDKSAVEVSDS